MKPTPTPPEITKAINAMFDEMTPRLQRLYDRWQDERQYEDFADYVDVVRSTLPKDFRILGMTKRPFGFTFAVKGFSGVYAMQTKATMTLWKRVG